MGRPADTARVGWLVIFALNHVLSTSIEEAEYCVIHVLPDAQRGKAFAEIVAGLGIDLRMSVEVGVAEGARPRALVCIYVRPVVRNADRYQRPPCGVSRADVPCQRRLPHQVRSIAPPSQVVILRFGISH